MQIAEWFGKKLRTRTLQVHLIRNNLMDQIVTDAMLQPINDSAKFITIIINNSLNKQIATFNL